MTRKRVSAYSVISLFPVVLLAGIFAGTADLGAEAVYIVPPSSAGSESPALTAVLKFQSLVYYGSTIAKPTCDAGWTSRIFVWPSRVAGGNGGYYYPITGFVSYALDYGTYWFIVSQVKNVQAPYAVYADGWVVQSIAQVWCCKNANCAP